MTEIQIAGLSHTFRTGDRTTPALRDISLDVPSEITAGIVGTSGCGKTTFIKCLSGLVSPTSGTITFDGIPVDGVPESVGVIFQDYDATLLPWKTVYNNVRIGAELGGRDDVDGTTEDYLELVNLNDFSHSYPKELSGGMKQRVQVARVLAYGPNVLLCDEPFGALDTQTKERLQDEFLQILSRESATTLFITHDVEEAIYMSDRVYVFTASNPGRIGETVEIPFERPRFPKSAFEKAHVEEIVDYKQRIEGHLSK